MTLAGPDSWITGGAIDFPNIEDPETELEPMTLLDLVYAVVLPGSDVRSPNGHR